MNTVAGFVLNEAEYRDFVTHRCRTLWLKGSVRPITVGDRIVVSELVQLERTGYSLTGTVIEITHSPDSLTGYTLTGITFHEPTPRG